MFVNCLCICLSPFTSMCWWEINVEADLIDTVNGCVLQWQQIAVRHSKGHVYSYPQSDTHPHEEMTRLQLLVFLCWCSSIFTVTSCFTGTAHLSSHRGCLFLSHFWNCFNTAASSISHLVVWMCGTFTPFVQKIVHRSFHLVLSHIPVIDHSGRFKGNVKLSIINVKQQFT